MEQRHRDVITHNINDLIKHTNYEKLLSECRRMRLLSDIMIEIIKENSGEDTTRHRKLLEKIKKRGPNAYHTLLEICKENFPPAYNVLKSNENIPSSVSNKQNSNQDQFISTFNANRQRSISVHSGNRISTPAADQRMRNPSFSTFREERNWSTDGKVMSKITDTGMPLLEEFSERFEPLYEVKPTTRETLLHRHPKLEAYPMVTEKNRGVVFILNVIEYQNDIFPKRNGAEQDKVNLVSLFRQLGFKIFYYEKLNNAEFDDVLKQLKQSGHLMTECFALFILAHGIQKKGQDTIFLYDGSCLQVEQILQSFNNTYPTLIGKPKMFFFSICRGDQPDSGIRSSMDTEHDGVPNNMPTNMPTYADMLICFSTVPGFAAHRDKFSGSWFVECICEVWSENAHNTDVEQLMKLVGKMMASFRTEKNQLQTLASEQRGFFNVLFLNPGYWTAD